MAKKIIPGINLKAERELTVEITKEDIENEIENVAKIYRKRAKIKGFRPGRAPLELVKATFKDEILEDARSEALKKKICNHLPPLPSGQEYILQAFSSFCLPLLPHLYPKPFLSFSLL